MIAKLRYTSVSALALAFASVAPGAAHAAYAQVAAGTGTINGTVTNETGETSLEGAIVRIDELGRETATGGEGQFSFGDVPAGTYTVSVTYFGAEPFTGAVTVTAGQTARLDLRPAQENAIVVTGIRGNLFASRSRERASDVLQSVISADAAGEFGDQNLAESLQRAPGVSIIRSEGEGTQVSIRGLAPQFTKVTIDGVQLGASGDDRSSSLDTISSDLASAITVSKYQLPDMPADAVGGTVDIEGLSAFDRGGFSLSLRGEGSYQEESRKVSPLFSASTTFLTGIFGGEDNLGISLAANWSKRYIDVDVIDGDQPPYLYIDRQGDAGYVPDKIILQREQAERTRYGLSGAIEYRPTEDDEIYIRSTFARDRDVDQAFIQEWDIDNSQGGDNGTAREVGDINGDSFVLADADILAELSHQPEIDRSLTATFGGEHRRGNITVDYQGYYSRRKIFKDNFIKGEWREQNILVAGSTTPDGYDIRAIDRAEFSRLTGYTTSSQLPPTNTSDGNYFAPGNYDQIQVQTEDGLRDDKTWALRANVRNDFLMSNDREGYVKAGLSYMDRNQIRDRDRKNYNPTLAADRERICGTDAACLSAIGSTLADFELALPKNGIITLPMPTFDQVVPFFNQQADNYLDRATYGTSRDDVLTTGDDYDANEKIYAGYLMGQIEATDQINITGGVRIERTEFSSNGFLTVNNEGAALEGDPAALVFTAPLGVAEKSYTDIFPSVLIRYEPARNIIMRAAYSTSTLRPNFNQARNSIVSEDDFLSDDSGTPDDPSDDVISSELGLRLGRPDLDPYFSHNFDLSLAYYPNASTVLSVAGFYKSIKDFIVDTEFSNVTLAELGFLELPSVGQFTFDPNQTYESIETTINGDSAKVYGVEVDFSHAFRWMPGPFSNLFIQGNATIARSTSAVETLRDTSIPLVGQADLVANLSVGYEDDRFTARVSGNYSGERLDELGAEIPAIRRLDPDSDLDRFGDLYIESYFSVDASLRFKVTKQLQLSFDAINLNNESDDINYKRSNRNYFSEREIYGRTFKAGLRYSF